MYISLRQQAHLVKHPKGGSEMDLFTFIMLATLVVSFVILPGIFMAMESNGTPIKDFFIGALVVPVLFGWSSLITLVLINIPDSVINNGDHPWLGFFTFLSVLFGGLGLGAFLFIKTLEKINN